MGRSSAHSRGGRRSGRHSGQRRQLRYHRLFPRFPVTYYTELRYITGYEVSETVVDVRYIIKDEGMRYDLLSPAKHIDAHILMPKGKTCRTLTVNGEVTAYTPRKVAESDYLDFTLNPKPHQTVSIQVEFA